MCIIFWYGTWQGFPAIICLRHSFYRDGKLYLKWLKDRLSRNRLIWFVCFMWLLINQTFLLVFKMKWRNKKNVYWHNNMHIFLMKHPLINCFTCNSLVLKFAFREFYIWYITKYACCLYEFFQIYHITSSWFSTIFDCSKTT